MELKIDNELATSIFRDAFLKAIPEAERERIFVKAIGDLLSEGRDRSYGRSTWLSDAMEHAARALLGEAIRDYCAQPEQRAKLEAAVKQVADKVLDTLPAVIGDVTAKVLQSAVYKAAQDRD